MNGPTESVPTLASYTCPGLMLPRLTGRDPAAVLGELCAALQQSGHVPDLLPFYQAALNREFLSSTAMPPGWAIPHARLRTLAEPCFAVGRGEPPISWSGYGVTQVRLVFLFAVPETDATGYMNLVSGLARLSRDPARAERLATGTDAAAMFQVLTEVPLRPARTVGQVT